jgi:hypothetical protein
MLRYLGVPAQAKQRQTTKARQHYLHGQMAIVTYFDASMMDWA